MPLRIVEILESFRDRKPMYVGGIVDVRSIELFLSGFETGLFACGVPHGIDLEVTTERGWEINALGPVRQMRDRGFTDDEIIDEIFAIKIETYRRFESRVQDGNINTND